MKVKKENWELYIPKNKFEAMCAVLLKITASPTFSSNSNFVKVL